MNQEQYKTVRKLHNTVLGVVAIVVIAVGVYIGLTLYYFDTSDWFEPTNDVPLLEVRDGGTLADETYNPQPQTIDGRELQQTADMSEIEGWL